MEAETTAVRDRTLTWRCLTSQGRGAIRRSWYVYGDKRIEVAGALVKEEVMVQVGAGKMAERATM